MTKKSKNLHPFILVKGSYTSVEDIMLVIDTEIVIHIEHAENVSIALMSALFAFNIYLLSSYVFQFFCCHGVFCSRLPPCHKCIICKTFFVECRIVVGIMDSKLSEWLQLVAIRLGPHPRKSSYYSTPN